MGTADVSPPANAPGLPPYCFNVPSIAELLGISVPSVYRMFYRGDLISRKIGGRTVVLRKDLEAYLDALPAHRGG
ncbi:helix-turn-helix domain-containing protein [Roseibium aggregatum]|uniref:helix-turn-helix domain-containing protein n=1 Tax=Roseibium aggregatum TaxID=187304 RepID=UPI001A8FD9F0|nr:helix-turn-helix domain-containing protein [Roseibium aggregatum]MBN8182022.1 helix-turn-helix domain-containing protein [Roseibium aggregatum]